MSEQPIEAEAPPAGEQIHLPGPSLVPVINAFGVALALVGLTMSWWVTGAGLVLFVLSLLRWVADTRRDIDALPLDHGAGH